MFTSLLRSTGIGSLVLTTMLIMAGCGVAVGPQLAQDLDPAPGVATFEYVGAQQGTYVVPDGVTSVTITATGGSGGNAGTNVYTQQSASGARVSGTVAVQPGQVLLINVAGDGESTTSKDHDPQGGWGGLGASGGNGNAASDSVRSGAAGGGASTVQLTDASGNNPQTILVAGGGGGAGGPSGDPGALALGGVAGCTGSQYQTPSWTGTDGDNGSTLKGGKGGSAGAENGPAGGRGKGGSGLGGNGGGGGGGEHGGDPGGGAKGASSAGGGGAGSSATYTTSATSVTCAVDVDGRGLGNGQVVVEQVTTS